MAYVWIMLLCFSFSASHNVLGYYLSDRVKSYVEAELFCHSKGSHLVKIDSEEKYMEIIRLLNRSHAGDIWIGLRSYGYNYYVYRYPDGIRAEFFKWYSKEPNMVKTDRCVRITRKTKMYRTCECSTQLHFLCDMSGDLVSYPLSTINGLAEEGFSHTQDISLAADSVTTPQVETTSHSEPTTIIYESTPSSTETSQTKSTVYKCACTYLSPHDENFENIINERKKKIKENLSLNKSILSKIRRQKYSAPDDRASSRLIGLVGVVFLIMVAGAIIVPDVISTLRFLINDIMKPCVSSK